MSLCRNWLANLAVVPNAERGFGVQKSKLPSARLMILLPGCKSEGITDDPVNARQMIGPRTSMSFVFQHRRFLTHDSYEIGTNPLFDDRTEEPIIHDPQNESGSAHKKPDRVYGLQCTKNFDQLLSKPVSMPWGEPDGCTVGERVRTSPFKERPQPLLFPFLILEAKSESSPNGFGAIQKQTASPIFALLKLQEDLQGQARASDSAAAPLVWFFAYRGDAWRVYGCFVSNSETSRYVCVDLRSICLALTS